MTVYFYYPRLNEIDADRHIASDSLDHWIFETYKQLQPRLKDFDIFIGDSIPQEGIVIFMSRHFPKNVKPGNRQFFVCVQADKSRYPFAQWHIVHNPFQTSFLYTQSVMLNDFLHFTNTVCLDPWPIGNLKKRNPSRGSTIQNLCFHGNICNLPASIQTPYFNSFIEERGMTFRVYDQPATWSDFTSADLSFCMRDFDGKKHFTKPYLKITNSLLANVPVAAGMDSSSEYFRKHYLDIPLLKSQQQLEKYLDDIAKNLVNPFEQVRKFDVVKARFTIDGVVDQWEHCLNKITKDYSKWMRTGSVTQKLFMKMRSLRNPVSS